MGIINTIALNLRDTKRVFELDKNSALKASELFATMLRLSWLSHPPRESATTSVLDFSVKYQDPRNLEFLFRELFIGRLYDGSLGSERPLIVDCGCNIGMSVLFFKALHPDARIIGFEPHPGLYAILEENIRMNGLQDVELHRSALSHEVGTVEFFINETEPGSLNMGLIQRDDLAESISVSSERLSNYVEGKVDLLKLDVEGAEEGILRDLVETGKIRMIDTIICEYHHHINEGENQLSHTLSMLEDSGFEYQLAAYVDRPARYGAYQDVMVYAHRKS